MSTEDRDRWDTMRIGVAKLLVDQRISANVFEICWNELEMGEFVVEHERRHLAALVLLDRCRDALDSYVEGGAVDMLLDDLRNFIGGGA